VKVYSTEDGTLLYELKKHTDWVTAIEFSPDGKNLASADRNGGLIVSDAQTGNENFDLAGHKEMVTSVAWRIDGKILGSVSKDKTVRIWEMKKGKQIKNWGADGKGLTGISFLPGGALLTAGREKNVKLWQQDGKHLQTFNGLSDMAMGLAYCAQTKRVVAGSFQGDVLVWDRDKPDSVGKLNANPPPISERVIDVHQQWLAALKTVDDDQLKLQNHDTTLEQIVAETAESEDKFTDLQKKIGDAKTKVASSKKETQDAKTKVKELEEQLAKKDAPAAPEGDGDEAEGEQESEQKKEEDEAQKKQKREQLQAQQKRVKELEQQVNGLNKQIAAWDGASAKSKSRIANLQKETGRLKDARKPLATKLETSRADATRLGKVLEFWKAEAEFAKGNTK